MSSHRISIAVSAELLSAITAEAFENDETRSATVRAILTDHLRDTGRMSLKAPPTLQLGQHNPRYVTRGRA